MIIDITLPITTEMLEDAQSSPDKSLTGHLGTHFDCMNREFPLEYTSRKAVVFDVSGITGRDIGTDDIDVSRVRPDTFVAFYTGYIETEPYGTSRYFREHPQLSRELIDALLERHISIIGVDCGGIRRGKEHTPTDQYCADRGVFVVENLYGLRSLTNREDEIQIHTYPLRCTGITGLPCRVLAEIL